MGRRRRRCATAAARVRGCRELAFDTELDNQPSRRAHLAVGFEEVAVVRCFRRALASAAEPDEAPRAG